MELTKEQRILSQVIEKAWDDPDFKAELIASPMKVIKKTTGETLDLPRGVQLQVHDQTDPSFAHINIPAKPNIDEMELTDDQLEMVAGGDMLMTIAIIISAATLSYMAGKDRAEA